MSLRERLFNVGYVDVEDALVNGISTRSQQLKKMYFILTIIRYPEVLTTVAAYM